jgi:alpha-beta hydrolase superfamily lysophospholipase
MTTRKGANLLVFFHGQYGNQLIYDKLMHIRNISDTQVILVDYPGFGLSRKDPNIEGFMKTHKIVADWISNTWGYDSYDNIIVWGESLGGNPAIKFSQLVNVDRLILASTFASLAEMISSGMKTGPLGLFLMETLENTKLLKTTKAANVYILHSKSDTRIPFHHASLLLNAAGNKGELVEIRGDHADPIYDQSIITKIAQLIEVNGVCELAEIFYYMKQRYAGIAPLFQDI